LINEDDFNRLMEEALKRKQERLIKLDKALQEYLTSDNPNMAETGRKYGLTRQQVRNHYVRHLRKVSNPNNDSA